jgi:hypothetical protein
MVIDVPGPAAGSTVHADHRYLAQVLRYRADTVYSPGSGQQTAGKEMCKGMAKVYSIY